jgi:hypothetical protein
MPRRAPRTSTAAQRLTAIVASAVPNRAALARWQGVSRARGTQVMWLIDQSRRPAAA